MSQHPTLVFFSGRTFDRDSRDDLIGAKMVLTTDKRGGPDGGVGPYFIGIYKEKKKLEIFSIKVITKIRQTNILDSHHVTHFQRIVLWIIVKIVQRNIIGSRYLNREMKIKLYIFRYTQKHLKSGKHFLLKN